jgi:hypothetical protein
MTDDRQSQRDWMIATNNYRPTSSNVWRWQERVAPVGQVISTKSSSGYAEAQLREVPRGPLLAEVGKE